MRMSEVQVKQVCSKIIEALRSKHLVQFVKSETEVLTKMFEIFVKDLKVEDEINREAEKLLEQYARQMGSQIDKEKMFQLIKKQLIKDRNVVI